MEQEKIEDKVEGTGLEAESLPFLQSRSFLRLLWGVGIVLLLLVVFKAGELVENQKADYAYKWSQNYYPNFVGQQAPGIGLSGNSMMAHGVFGPIISINSPNLVVQDTDNNNIEKEIITSTDTVIRDLNSYVPITDLEVNEQVVVIGSPNASGQILARLIRVIPAPSYLPSSPDDSSTQTQ
jgi:hypothetical protein